MVVSSFRVFSAILFFFLSYDAFSLDKKLQKSPMWNSEHSIKIYEKPILSCLETFQRLEFFFQNHDTAPPSHLFNVDELTSRILKMQSPYCSQCHMFFKQEGALSRLLDSITRKNCVVFDKELKPFSFDHDLIVSSILNGIASSYDPFSKHLLPQDLDDLKIKMTGIYSGIGVLLNKSLHHSFPQIQSIVCDDPGHQAFHLKSGNLIVGIKKNDKTGVFHLKGIDVRQLVSFLRGDKDTSITLYTKKDFKDQKITQNNYIRKIIKVKSKETLFFDHAYKNDPFLVIKIPVFYPNKDCENYPSFCMSGIKKVILSHYKKYKGIVIDLRNNFGGDLNAAVDFASFFIGNKLIGYVYSPKNKVKKKPLISKNGKASEIRGPIVVIINRNTASAAEVFAAAVQNQNVGHVIGEKSRGKGAMQTLYEFFDERGEEPTGGFKITTGQVLLPRGEPLSQKGVLPGLVPSESSLDPKDHNINAIMAAKEWMNMNPL